MFNNNEDEEERAKLLMMELTNTLTEANTENAQPDAQELEARKKRRDIMNTCFNLFNIQTEDNISNLNDVQLITVCGLLGILETEQNFLIIREDLKLILRDRFNPAQNVVSEETSINELIEETQQITITPQTYYAEYEQLGTLKYNFLDHFEEDGLLKIIEGKINQFLSITLVNLFNDHRKRIITSGIVGAIILISGPIVGVGLMTGGTIAVVGAGGTLTAFSVYKITESLYNKGFHESYVDSTDNLNKFIEVINGLVKKIPLLNRLSTEIPVVRRNSDYKLLFEHKYVEIVKRPLLLFIENLNVKNFMFLFEDLIKQSEKSKELEIKEEFKLDLKKVKIVQTVNNPHRNDGTIFINKSSEITYESIIRYFNQLLNFIRAIDEDLKCYKYEGKIQPTYPEEYTPELTHKEKENVRNSFRLLCSSTTGKGLKIIQKFAEKNKHKDFTSKEIARERDNLQKKLEERELRI